MRNGTQTPPTGRAFGRLWERAFSNEEDLEDHSQRLSRIEKQQWVQSGILLLLLHQTLDLSPADWISTLLLSLF